MGHPIAKLLLASLLVISTSNRASASYLTCSETVNSGPSATFEQFPSTVMFELTVTEAWCQWCTTQDPGHWCYTACPASSYSVVASESDAVVAALLKGPIPWATTNPTWIDPFPFALKDGASISTVVEATLSSYSDCAAWGRSLTPPALPDASGRIVIVDKFQVGWSSGEYAECSAPVTCLPPLGPTRTLGYFKTHPAATAACVASAPIDLGFMTIAQGDTGTALGLLGASPAKYATGQKRSAFDQARILLGRQLLVAVCNGRVFGSAPLEPALIGNAIGAITASNCSAMNWMHGPARRLQQLRGHGGKLLRQCRPLHLSRPDGQDVGDLSLTT